MSRILVFVPNTATSDRRVLRQTASLMKAGHEVEIVGIVTNDKSAGQAITDEQIPVTRVPWRAATYRKLLFVALRRYFITTSTIIVAVVLLSLLFVFPMLLWIAEIAPTITFGTYTLVPFATAIIGFVLLVLGVFASLYLVKRVRNYLRRRKGFSDVAKASRIAENYAKMEASLGPEPFMFKILRWLYGQKAQNEKFLFKATIQARIDAMVEYGLEWRPEVVYCHEAACLPVGKKLKDKLGCKLVYDAHEIYDDLANASDAHSETYQAIHRKCFPAVDHFITVNPQVLGFYLKNYKSLKNYTVIPNTVFPKKLGKYDGRLHEAAKLDPDCKVLLYQGGFSPGRGLSILVDAAQRLPENWYLVMMGWGKIEEALSARVQNNRNEAIANARQVLVDEALQSESFKNEVQPLLDSHLDVGDKTSPLMDPTYEEFAPMVQQNVDGSIPVGGHTPLPSRYSARDLLLKRVLDASAKSLDSAMSANRAQGIAKTIAREISELDTEITRTFTSSTFESKKATKNAEFEREYMSLVGKIERKIKLEMNDDIHTGVFDKVRFIPGAPYEDLIYWSQGATIGIIPYENVGQNHWNCSPNKIWEYTNAGLPILASRMAFLNDVILKHGIGWTIPSDFVERDIYDKIEKLTDKDIAEKKANCAKFIAADNYLQYEPKLLSIFENWR